MPRLTRREFLAAQAWPLLAQRRRRIAEVERPSVLLILAEGLGAWMCGCYGNKAFRTPNIDLLARLGVRFQNAFVVTPADSPSRATLLTGLTPMQHGIHDFLTSHPLEDPPVGQAAPPPGFDQQLMISDLLAGVGYKCGYIGRWEWGNPERPGHGYEFTYTYLGPQLQHQDPVMSRNGSRVQEKGYAADLFTQAALEFLDSVEPGQPFFLVISYLNPNEPYDGHPSRYYELYQNEDFSSVGWRPPSPAAFLGREYLQDIVGNLRKAAAGLSALDDQVARLLKKLRERKVWSETLVIFTSLHGQLWGRHGLWDAGWGSNPINMFDEVVRVPLILSWPGDIPVEATRAEPVSTYDLLPTLCQLARIDPRKEERKLCGRSYLYPAMNLPLDKDEAPWPTLVFGYYRNTWMARGRRFKLVLRNDGEGPNEFYDLTQDPGERENQYENASYLTVRDDMRQRLEAWIKEHSA